MRQIHGLQKIHQQHPERLNAQKLAEILLLDLQQCSNSIYGCMGNDDKILLAKQHLQPETLVYDRFEQRLDLSVAGIIIRNDCVPLTYSLQGELFGITGRCSMIAKVCGVDLYLAPSYTGIIGDKASQKFSFALKSLLQNL